MVNSLLNTKSFNWNMISQKYGCNVIYLYNQSDIHIFEPVSIKITDD